MESSRSDMPLGRMPLTALIETADEIDLHRAAEAIVSAAIWKQQMRGPINISSEKREALVQAVMREPEMTELLFNGTAFRSH